MYDILKLYTQAMKKYNLIPVLFGLLLLFGMVQNLSSQNRNFQSSENYSQDIHINQSSSKSTYETINEMFDTKASSYTNNGFFPQLYEPSLQATYYGLSILDSLGKIDTINESQFVDYIMSHYNSSSGLFMDAYSLRYLGTDFSHAYYPLSTLLEVNTYALLSLSILNQLGLVNTQKLIDFLWSCYNPISSGFIGQPYSPFLEESFKISTMDNTYFALTALDLLMGAWTGYQTQRGELISYINTLQNINPTGWQYGGFYNDNTSAFNSLGGLFEPNMISSYYCIKSLEIFGMVSSINDVAFHQFLDTLYNTTYHNYQIGAPGLVIGNIVATALGLELSEIMSYNSINQTTDIMNFLHSNRNKVGLWDG
jgi:prenyltransferase beta subunit